MNISKFKVAEIDYCFDKEEVYFTLECQEGGEIVCYVEAEIYEQAFDVLPPSGNIEYAREVDFRWLVVSGESEVKIDSSCFDIEKVVLTESQLKDLNDYLNGKMEVVQ